MKICICAALNNKIVIQFRVYFSPPSHGEVDGLTSEAQSRDFISIISLAQEEPVRTVCPRQGKETTLPVELCNTEPGHCDSFTVTLGHC